eukprot:SAG31_NODE_966_length_10688_cov_8.343564_5_plen_325_part_00
MDLINGDTFSISALHLSIKVPYFSNSEHKNEKVTPFTFTVPPSWPTADRSAGSAALVNEVWVATSPCAAVADLPRVQQEGQARTHTHARTGDRKVQERRCCIWHGALTPGTRREMSACGGTRGNHQRIPPLRRRRRCWYRVDRRGALHSARHGEGAQAKTCGKVCSDRLHAGHRWSCGSAPISPSSRPKSESRKVSSEGVSSPSPSLSSALKTATASLLSEREPGARAPASAPSIPTDRGRGGGGGGGSSPPAPPRRAERAYPPRNRTAAAFVALCPRPTPPAPAPGPPGVGGGGGGLLVCPRPHARTARVAPPVGHDYLVITY